MKTNFIQSKNSVNNLKLNIVFSLFIFILLCTVGFIFIEPSNTSLTVSKNSEFKQKISVEDKQIKNNTNNIKLFSSPNYLAKKTNDAIILSDSKELSSAYANYNILNLKISNETNIIRTATICTNQKIQIKRPSHEFLPKYFDYSDVNKDKLRSYLRKRNSLLAEEPYFSTIISTGRDFNINPLILFAITGQEQSFVPKHQKNSYKIANNPFNVFHSWIDYNTNIGDATRIACRTVINLSKGRPSSYDPFLWINKEYCNDPDWGPSVRTIYKQLISKTQ